MMLVGICQQRDRCAQDRAHETERGMLQRKPWLRISLMARRANEGTYIGRSVPD